MYLLHDIFVLIMMKWNNFFLSLFIYFIIILARWEVERAKWLTVVEHQKKHKCFARLLKIKWETRKVVGRDEERRTLLLTERNSNSNLLLFHAGILWDGSTFPIDTKPIHVVTNRYLLLRIPLRFLYWHVRLIDRYFFECL